MAHDDDFEKVLKDHPLKVIRLSWLIATAIISIFAIMVSGYFFWDKKLDDNEIKVQTQINAIKDTINMTNTNVSVVDTKVTYMQRQLDQLSNDLKSALLAKNFQMASKKPAQAQAE